MDPYNRESVVFLFRCGDTVRDRVTGFEGVVQAQLSYLFGCNRYGVQAHVGGDNKLEDWHYFDEPALELVEVGHRPRRLAETGGPRPDPGTRRA